MHPTGRTESDSWRAIRSPRIAVTGGRVSCAGVSVEFSPDDPTSLLIAYLRVIRRRRNQRKVPAIALRRDDILTLAEHLDLDGAEVVDRLSTLMDVSLAQRTSMAMLFATGAIVIGLAAGGHASSDAATDPGLAPGVPAASERLVAAPQPDPAITTPVAVVDTASVPAIARAADTAGLSTAKRVQASVVAPPSAAPEGSIPNQSQCNPDPTRAVMTMVVPDIAFTCPVHEGGQSTIDAGFVTLVTAAGANPVLATRPGEPGTLWLAGHRTTNGAAFARVPDLADGALVTVSSGDVTATYRVVGRSYVEVRDDRVIDASGNATAAATWASIIRDDFGGNHAPRLVLQTCEGERFRWMIYADLVG